MYQFERKHCQNIYDCNDCGHRLKEFIIICHSHTLPISVHLFRDINIKHIPVKNQDLRIVLFSIMLHTGISYCIWGISYCARGLGVCAYFVEEAAEPFCGPATLLAGLAFAACAFAAPSAGLLFPSSGARKVQPSLQREQP